MTQAWNGTLCPGFPMFQSASCDDTRNIEIEECYLLDSINDFVPFVFSRAKKGQLKIYVLDNYFYYFTVDSISINREGSPMSGGKFQVRTKMNLSLLKQNNTLIDPTNLQIYNFKVSGVKQDESIGIFYPCENDLLVPAGSNTPYPFINSAGIPLEGVMSRGLTQLSFSYNIPVSDFDINRTWQCIDKVNKSEITIAGINFTPRTIRTDSLSFEYCKDEVKYVDLLGSEITQEYCYYRVDLSLIADPLSHNRKYLNIGSYVKRYGQIQKIWTWTVNNVPCYGTYNQYLSSSGEDGEEINENMFLNADGDSVAGVTNGYQNQTYRYGSLYEPIEFSILQIPTGPPENWSNT